MGEQASALRRAGGRISGMGIAWRAVTLVSAASVGVAVAGGVAAAVPSDGGQPLAVLRGLLMAASGGLMAVGTFRTMRFALFTAGVPTDQRFVPDGAPRFLADARDHVIDSRRIIGAGALLVGLLLGLLGARVGGGGEALDDRFAELPRYGYEHASDGGFAVDVPDTAATSRRGQGITAGRRGDGDGRAGDGTTRARTGEGVDGDSEQDGSTRDGRDPTDGDDDGDDDGDGCTGASCGGSSDPPPESDLDADVCQVIDHTEGEVGKTLGSGSGGTVDATTDGVCETLDQTTDTVCGAVGQGVCSTVDDTVDTVDGTLDTVVDDGKKLLGGLLDSLTATSTTSSSPTTSSTLPLLGGVR